jgi:hypothetical protein
MPRKTKSTITAPPRLSPALEAELSKLPPFHDRQRSAELVLRIFGFTVSPRTLEVWPVATRRVNGRAMIETRALFEHAQRMLDQAPIQAGNRRSNEAA